MRPIAPSWLVAFAALALAGARPALAQSASIDSAMTRAQVVERLGAPASERSSGGRTYLFYQNGCERTCGMHDLVVLVDDAVVDAIFRSPSRRYTGRSSSPVAVPPSSARAASGAGRGATGGAARRRAAKPAPARAALPEGTKAGGIVTGGDITGGAASTPARTVGTAGGAAPSQGAPAATRENARDQRTLPGPVRVPTLPRDTLLPPPPGERGQRTLPGPAKVPTLPRDTSVARPDSARPKPPARPDSTPPSPGTN